MNDPRHAGPAYRLRFVPLVERERAIDIPCDAQGHVDLDKLSELSRNAYFYARSLRDRLFTVSVAPFERN